MDALDRLLIGMLLLILPLGLMSPPVRADNPNLIWLPQMDSIFPEYGMQVAHRHNREPLIRAPHEFQPVTGGGMKLVTKIELPAEQSLRSEDIEKDVESIKVSFPRPVAGQLRISFPGKSSPTRSKIIPANQTVVFSDLPEFSYRGSYHIFELKFSLKTDRVAIFWGPGGMKSPVNFAPSIQSAEFMSGQLTLGVHFPRENKALARLMKVAETQHQNWGANRNNRLRIEFVSGIDSGRKMEEIGYWLRPLSDIQSKE